MNSFSCVRIWVFTDSVACVCLSRSTISTIEFNTTSIGGYIVLPHIRAYIVLPLHKCNCTSRLVIYVSRTSCTCVGGRGRRGAVLRGSLNILESLLSCLDVTLISYVGKSHPPTRWNSDIVPSHETASCSARVDATNKYSVKVYFSV